MTQVLSVSCKLQVPNNVRPAIDRTMEGFAEACNQILVAAQSHKCYNATKLHHLIYKTVREATGLKANHVCQAIRRVLGNLKATKKIKKFRPTSVSLDARTFVYHPDTQEVGITLIDKRHKFKLLIGNYQRALLNGQTPSSATLVKRRDGSFYINIAIELDTPPTGKTPKVVGVDLGRRDIATTSTGKAWNGTKLQQTRDRYSRVRANVSSKRTSSSRKLLIRLSGRERRFQEWVNHNISKELVTEAHQLGAALAFEDLTNIRESLNQKPRTKEERRRTNNWAFYQLRMFVNYKAAIAGIQVVFIPPAYTSRTCSRCHHIHPEQGKSFRNGKKFKCGHCGFEHDADMNAAINIAQLGVVYVNQPEIPGITCLVIGAIVPFPIR
ncbi:MAG: RNA-guided endonuclease TnpB family protein [Coleofasciculaceae cyanobacterium]